MSETLPPVTGTGVTLSFVYPFDRTVPRHATISWRRIVGGQTIDTAYVDVEQGGDTAVVHEQVTFPGDTWVAIEKGGTKLLALHVATGEREQRVAITRRSSDAAQSAPSVAALPAEADEDADLRAAIAASLNLGAEGSSSAAPATAPSAPRLPHDEADEKLLRDALAMSRELVEEQYRSGRAPAVAPEEMRRARLRRFEKGPSLAVFDELARQSAPRRDRSANDTTSESEGGADHA